MLHSLDWQAESMQSPSSRGLPNKTNVMCYRNSALTALLHVPAFINWLNTHSADSCNLSMSGDDCLACHIRDFSSDYWSGRSETKALYDRLDQLWQVCKSKFWTYPENEQQDVVEFLTSTLQYLELEFDRSGMVE